MCVCKFMSHLKLYSCFVYKLIKQCKSGNCWRTFYSMGMNSFQMPWQHELHRRGEWSINGHVMIWKIGIYVCMKRISFSRNTQDDKKTKLKGLSPFIFHVYMYVMYKWQKKQWEILLHIYNASYYVAKSMLIRWHVFRMATKLLRLVSDKKKSDESGGKFMSRCSRRQTPIL